MSTGRLTFVVMAKRPEAGRVKTRLVRAGLLDAPRSAVLAMAMLRCTVRRLRVYGDVVLAVTPDGAAPDLVHALGVAGLEAADQGEGDLGERLDRLWRVRGGPVAFFGMDSPDVPCEVIASIGPALRDADLAIGPTPDGGFWTLAARRYEPLLRGGIDWGGPSVYDQTRRRALRSGLTVRELAEWRDVDEPDDVGALRERLAARAQNTPAEGGNEPLRILAVELEAVWAERHHRHRTDQ